MSSNSARPRAGVDSEKQSFSTGDSKVPPGPPILLYLKDAKASFCYDLLMDQPQDIYYRKSHVKPIRTFVRKAQGEYQPVLDVQIKAELKDLDDPVRQTHSLSIYLKPPNNMHFKLRSKRYSFSNIGNGQVNFELKTIKNSILRNPYISWHGSGEIHANAYHKYKGVNSQRIVSSKEAMTWRDVKMGMDLVLRAVVPIGEEGASFKLPAGQTLDLLSAQSTGSKPIPENIILAEDALSTDSVHIDVYIHNRGFRVSDINQLPFPPGAEILWLAPPLTFENKDSPFAPAVTIFYYQPVNNSTKDDGPTPLILIGITKQHPYGDVYIQAIKI